MEQRPTKGLKVFVNARREAIFGDDSVSVQTVALNDATRLGVMTGLTLAGFCEVDMQRLDGRRHWYPIEDLAGESGEKIAEEEIPLELEEDGSEEPEQEPA
jgi:hypothetical protein